MTWKLESHVQASVEGTVHTSQLREFRSSGNVTRLAQILKTLDKFEIGLF